MPKNTLYVIDFDRTLVSVDEFMQLAGQACSVLGLDFTSVSQAQADASAAGRSFSPLKAIDGLGDTASSGFKEKFLELAEPDKLIYPDAQRLIDKLEQAGKQYLVLTYAVDEDWQALKLQASGLNKAAHLVTLNMIKTEDIVSWQDSSGLYVPPIDGITPAERIVLIDDRLRVFEGLPENCVGFYLVRSQTGPGQADLPAGIKQITSLDEIAL